MLLTIIRIIQRHSKVRGSIAGLPSGQGREGRFPRNDKNMQPKEMADLFFSRQGIQVMDILKGVLFFVFLFSCSLFWWLSHSQESTERPQNIVSQWLPSRSPPSGSVQGPAEHFRSCSPIGVNENAGDPAGHNSLLRAMKKSSINLLPKKKRSG